VEAARRKLVRERAGGRCEYCHIHQDDDPFFRLHVEHILPKKHGGTDVESNLALACHHCNLHKGPNLTGVDPQTGAIVPLFDPRGLSWAEHFAIRGTTVVGLSPVGRVTVRVMAMNAAGRRQLRSLSRYSR
jgi:hypothetical protein